MRGEKGDAKRYLRFLSLCRGSFTTSSNINCFTPTVLPSLFVDIICIHAHKKPYTACDGNSSLNFLSFMSVIPLNRLDTTSLSPQELAQIGEYGAIIIGAGHNGLTAAARLASQGVDNILVLERSDHIGGACTLKEWSTPAGKLIISPCAYLCGSFQNCPF